MDTQPNANHTLEDASRRQTQEIRPETTRRLDLINEMALYDETHRDLTFPTASGPGPAADVLMTKLGLVLHNLNPETTDVDIWSFDIDLTLEMPDDEPRCRGTVPVSRPKELQANGAIVGTCSDREPSGQRRSMESMGFSPDFCIPKEMLRTLAQLMKDANIVHVGDDERRDRRIALQCGVAHRWPSEM